MADNDINESIICKLINSHCVLNGVELTYILKFKETKEGNIGVDFECTSPGELKQIWLKHEFHVITEEEYLREVRNTKVKGLLDV